MTSTRCAPDTKGLLLTGLELAAQTWKEAVSAFDREPGGFDHYLLHQVSKVHTRAVCDTLGLDIDRFPPIYPHYGNIGPAGVPTLLSSREPSTRPPSGSTAALDRG